MKISTSVSVPAANIGSIASDGVQVWVTSPFEKNLHAVDPLTGEVTPHPFHRLVNAISYDGNSYWFADNNKRILERYQPPFSAPLGVFFVPEVIHEMGDFCYGAGRFWLIDKASASVYGISAVNPEDFELFELDQPIRSVAFYDGYLAYSVPSARQIGIFDTVTGHHVYLEECEGQPTAITLGPTYGQSGIFLSFVDARLDLLCESRIDFKPRPADVYTTETKDTFSI